MTNSAAPLVTIFTTSDHLVPLVLGDLSAADSRTRARGTSGPSIAWHIGHLLSHRCEGLRLLGLADSNPYAASFGDRAATDGADYPTPSELQAQWREVSARLLDALSSATDEALARPVGGGAHAEECVRDKVAFLAFHEGYHLGAVAALQKTLGKSSPPEKIMAAMQAGS